MDALEARVDNLFQPTWFVRFTRPKGFPVEGWHNAPDLPFTVVGVPNAYETEIVYRNIIRGLPAYCAAFGLTRVQAAHHAFPENLLPVEVGDNGKVKRVMFLRQDRFFFRYARRSMIKKPTTGCCACDLHVGLKCICLLPGNPPRWQA